MTMPSPSLILSKDGPPIKKMAGERLRLLIVQGKNKGHCYCLTGNTITFGRENSTIILDDENVSRKHIELEWKENHYLAKDLGSANGFIHNNLKTKEAVLKPDDILIIGLSVFAVLAPGQIEINRQKNSQDSEVRKKQREEQAKLAKNRLFLIMGAVFLLYLAFSPSDQVKTLRESSKIESEEENKPKKKKASSKEALEAMKEYIPDYSMNTQQRRDAEIFFRNGMRELHNKNYRRAINAFDTALTVDPSHDLAKRYLKTAKKDFEEEIKSAFLAATQARKSMRYKEARMHYENILRYLEGDTLNSKFIESTEALKQLDKEESKIQ